VRKKAGFSILTVRTILYLLGLILLFLMIFPFIYMLLSSLKEDSDVFTKSIFYVPMPPKWNNYTRVWTEIAFPAYYFNTIKVTLGATLLQLFVSATAGYAFAKLHVPGKKLIFSTYLATMMVPWTAIMIPQFVVISKLGLYNTHLALILLQSFSGFGIFMLRQFFMTIPNELSEAAVIDGAGQPRIFVQIILPLAKSGLSALTVFTFIQVWNDYQAPLIYLQAPQLRTLQLGISLFRSQYSMDYSVIMAGTACALLPIVILYVLAEKNITQGIAFSGMKN